MPFPPHKRVEYQRNPLTEVIFQARFNRLLEIESSLPLEYQSKIGNDYPILEQRNIFKISFQSGAPQPGATPLGDQSREYDFLSQDRNWKISLSSGFIALSTRKYIHWESFRDRLNWMLNRFFEVYHPPFFTRLGLRYQNLIVRSSLDLERMSWQQLLKPQILGELFSDAIPESDVESRQANLLIRLSENERLQVSHGFLMNAVSAEVAYMIDSDFSWVGDRKADVDDAIRATNGLKDHAGRFFRWCISDQLHSAMDPKPIAERE